MGTRTDIRTEHTSVHTCFLCRDADIGVAVMITWTYCLSAKATLRVFYCVYAKQGITYTPHIFGY